MKCQRTIGPYPCCSVIQGDCLELMKVLPDGCVDAVITDPPYGVGFSYDSHDDSSPSYLDWVLSCFSETRRISTVVMLTTGMRNLWHYPKPNWVLCWAKPGSTRRSDLGGFNEWEPVLVYGKPRIYNDFKYLPDCVNHSEESGSHPCPKPLRLLEWLIEQTEGVILDPFLGSGTTAVAAKKLGRHFLGFEISEEYCRIARDRIALVENQGNLFQPQAEQLSL